MENQDKKLCYARCDNILVDIFYSNISAHHCGLGVVGERINTLSRPLLLKLVEISH